MTRKHALLLWTLFLSLLALSLYEHFKTGNAGDKNWLLLAAGMWLNGKKIAVDIIEVNPPLILWFYAIPVWISRQVQFLSDAQALALMGMVSVAGIMALCDRLMRQHPQFALPETRAMLALLLAFIFLFYPENSYFFDRDYIFFLFTFPYLLRFMPSLASAPLSGPLRLVVALCAAFGFCMKPQSLLVFIVIQLAYALTERSLRILVSLENGVIYAAGVLYIASVLILTPEYVHIVVPMALATYKGFKNNGFVFLFVAVMIYGVSLVDFRPRHRSPYRKDIYYFLCAALGLLIYAQVNNGWGYTYYPFTGFGLFLSGWLVWHYSYLLRHVSPEQPVKGFLFGRRACIIVLLCNLAFAAAGLVGFFTVSACDRNVECHKYKVLLGAMEQRHLHSFGVLSFDYHKWAQLARASGAAWDTRFNALWMLPEFLMSGEDFRNKNQWIIDYLDMAFAEDLNQRQPQAIFVEHGYEVKLPGYFCTSNACRQAWNHYRLTASVNICTPFTDYGSLEDCQYDIYERAP